jgi:hypothetical protein
MAVPIRYQQEAPWVLSGFLLSAHDGAPVAGNSKPHSFGILVLAFYKEVTMGLRDLPSGFLAVTM